MTLCIQWARSDAQSATIKERDAEEKRVNGEVEGDEKGEEDARSTTEKTPQLYIDGEADSQLGMQVLSFY